MSLVAYDSSDESEEEIVFSPLSKTTQPRIVSDSTAKRQRECVKITIPSLKEFEDDEHYVVPKKPKLQSGSGLFSLLPPPKNSFSKPGFIPYVLSSKKETFSPVPEKCETKLTKTETLASGVFEKQHFDDEVYSNEKSLENNSNDAATNKDFFSLDDHSSKNKLDEKNDLSFNYLNTNNSLAVMQSSRFTKSTPSSVQLPVTSSSGMQHSFLRDSMVNSSFQQNHLPSSVVAIDKQEHLIDQQSTSYTSYSTDTMIEFNSKESLLKDKEFLKLQGRRHESEAVNIIDVKADDQLTDRNEWLMKSLTEESTHRPSRKKHNMPTQQQKRKHQITYLAFQAKEREMDLKNQWALNSRTRRETQAKYGF